ncbi:STAS domain-containing protein [Planobispora takensis]|uniref:STAS domain-containing protein n=1 Tax=Planobispora takensis TaxID=1367882 RepID=A0A8J3WUN7_9ACTN|nr:STAS domain-containing protein [Planobispora takensis]GII03114.1 hypothetical protein Pta02_51220 [Planobispora takensis]
MHPRLQDLQAHSRPSLTVARGTVTLPHDDAGASDGAACHGVIGAVLYADRQLRLIYHPHPGATLIHLIGEVDAGNCAALEEMLIRVGHGDDRLLIDAQHLRFIDTGGVRLLARLSQQGTARLINVPSHLQHLADLLDLPLRTGTPNSAHHRPRQE